MSLKVAVTGPTGDIGRSLLRVLEHDDRVGSVVGMARRPFDPAAQGLTKTTYLQGDMTDRAAVDRLVAGADVVVHLAFIILAAADAHDVTVSWQDISDTERTALLNKRRFLVRSACTVIARVRRIQKDLIGSISVRFARR